MDETCKFCGRYSYGWGLCRDCYELKKQGKLILTRHGWQRVSEGQTIVPDMIYTKRARLITPNEQEYLCAIHQLLPEIIPDEQIYIFPQVGFSALVEKSDGPRRNNHTELFRVVDFVLTDKDFCPLVVIEVNDNTHRTNNSRIQRDMTIKGICGEANLPVAFLDTRRGLDRQYIKGNIRQAIDNIGKTERKPYIFKVVNTGGDTTEQMAPVNCDQPQSSEKKQEGDIEKTESHAIVINSEWRTLLHLTIFGGLFGLHRLYKGKIWTGFLYFVTFGLFGLGWIFDVIYVASGNFKDSSGRKISRIKKQY